MQIHGRIRNGLLRAHPQRPAAAASATACCGRIRNGLLRPHPQRPAAGASATACCGRILVHSNHCGPSSGITDFF
jgi:hypothetical protein